MSANALLFFKATFPYASKSARWLSSALTHVLLLWLFLGSSLAYGQDFLSAAPTCPNNSTINETCINNPDRLLSNITFGPQANVKGGKLTGTIVNQGWLANVTILPGSTVGGGTLTGYIDNQGTVSNITFRGAVLTGGKLAGTIINESVLKDVTILPDATVKGGQLLGTIVNQGTLQNVGTPYAQVVTIKGGTIAGQLTSYYEYRALLEETTVAANTVLTNVKLGNKVKMDSSAVVKVDPTLVESRVSEVRYSKPQEKDESTTSVVQDREVVNITYVIDKQSLPPVKVVNDNGEVSLANRNLVLESFSTGQTSTNDQVTTQQGYLSDVILKEQGENGKETIVFQSFQVGQWQQQLNAETTILSKVFINNPILLGLPASEQERVAKQVIVENQELFTQATKTWKRVINGDILFNLVVDKLVNELSTLAIVYVNLTPKAETIATRSRLPGAEMTVGARHTTRASKADLKLGWVDVTYDNTKGTNCLVFDNYLPLTLSVVSGGYSFDDYDDPKLGPLWGPILGPNLLNEAKGGLAAMLASFVYPVGSVPTQMCGTTFDKELFPNDKLNTGFKEQKYVASKEFGLNIHTINNMGIALKVILGVIPGLDKYLKELKNRGVDIRNTLEEIKKVAASVSALVDGLLLYNDLIYDLVDELPTNPANNAFLAKYRMEVIDPFRNSLGNVKSILDKFSNMSENVSDSQTAFERLVGKSSPFGPRGLDKRLWVLKELISKDALTSYMIGTLLSYLVSTEEDCKVGQGEQEFSCSDFAYIYAFAYTHVIGPNAHKKLYEGYLSNKDDFVRKLGRSLEEGKLATLTVLLQEIPKKSVEYLKRLDIILAIWEKGSGALTAAIKADGLSAAFGAVGEFLMLQMEGVAKEALRGAAETLVKAALGANVASQVIRVNDLLGFLTAYLVTPSTYPFNIKVVGNQIVFTGPSLAMAELENQIDFDLNYQELGLSTKDFPCYGEWNSDTQTCRNSRFVLSSASSKAKPSYLLVANENYFARSRPTFKLPFADSLSSVNSALKSVKTNHGYDEPLLNWNYNIQRRQDNDRFVDFLPENNKVNNANVSVGQILDKVKTQTVDGKDIAYFDFFDILVKKQSTTPAWLPTWSSTWLFGENTASVLVRHASRGIYREIFDFAVKNHDVINLGETKFHSQETTFYKIASRDDLVGLVGGVKFEERRGQKQNFLCVRSAAANAIPLTLFVYEPSGKKVANPEFFSSSGREIRCFPAQTYKNRTFAVYDSIFSKYVEEIWKLGPNNDLPYFTLLSECIFISKLLGFSCDKSIDGFIREHSNVENHWSFIARQNGDGFEWKDGDIPTFKVYDETSGNVLAGVKVEGKNPEGREFLGTTNADGIFEQPDLVYVSPYTLTFCKEGYECLSKTEILYPVTPMPLEFRLKPGGGGKIEGLVKEAVTKKPLASVIVGAYQAGNLIQQVTTGEDGHYNFVLPGGSYHLMFSSQGYIPIEGDIDVTPPETSTFTTILEVSQAYAGIGTVSGRVINAFNGAGVDTVTLNVRSGVNVSSGNIVATTISDNSGNYKVNLPGGNYTIEATKEGYVVMKFPVVSIGEKTEGGQNVLLTPLLQQGQLRIVLSWSSQPSDLDSHLVTPTIEGNSYHILYNSKGVSNRAPYVQLDVDDTSSYGPETTTIYTRYPGKYYYYVHNFSEKGNSNSQGLTTSGAKVDVYSDKGLIKSYNVPLSGIGTYWQVFSYDGTTGEIETVNNISSVGLANTITPTGSK